MLGRMSTVQQPPAPPEPMSLEQRSAILAERLTWDARNGWRVTSQTQTQAQLAKGKPTSHLLHLVLTIITLGLWAIVWILVAIFGGEKHTFLSVDEYGRVTRT
jgi:hypothetical protein